MLDRLKVIQTKLVEFWNRFTSKQKTLIVSITAAVVFTLVALIVLLNRTKYVQLVTFDNTADAASADAILTEAGIKYQVSGDGLVFSVDQKNESAARLVLGQNNIAADKDTSYEEAFNNNSMSTTDSERKQKQIIYKQKQLEKDLQSMDGIKQASVHISVPDSSNSLLSETKESSASVMLVTTADFDSELQVEGIANFVATTVGNSNTDNIRIIDQAGNLLFGGETSTSTNGKAAMMTKIKDQVTASFKDQVRNLFISAGVYNDAEVAANLDINLDEQEIVDEHYYTDDAEEDTGPMSKYYSYSAENADGVSGIPGTDSNDGTVNDYDILNGTTTNSNVNVLQQSFDTSKTTTSTKKSIGYVNTANSSVALVLSRYVVYDEAKMKKTGELKGTNFETFQQANDERKPIEVDEDTYALVEQATGISADRIHIQAYEVPLFYPLEQSAADTAANYLQFILAVLIVALLCFVVFKGMKPVEVTELEPELSVEALLATTKENQTLEDIEFSDKSATRQQIERFVDENPEEVALLLRNWLNDDWD